MVRAEGGDQVELGGPADAGDLRAEDLGDLDGEGADGAARAEYSDALAGLRFGFVGRACRAVVPEIGTTAACSNERFAGLRPSLSSRAKGILGERAAGNPEDLVAGRAAV